MRLAPAAVLIAACCCAACAAGDAASVVAQRREMGRNRPFASAVPRSNEPTGELVVLRIWPDAVDMRIALGALQGIVNRDRPRLYIGLDKPLYWLEYYGGKVYRNVEPDVWKIFGRFKGQVKGVVVYGFSLDALANVAITYAGIEELIPATPKLAEELASRFGWKTRHDLRGRWKTRHEAYKWAFENLFSRCDKWGQRGGSSNRDLGPDKVYLAFTNSEHDNLEHVIGGGPPWHRLGMETDDPRPLHNHRHRERLPDGRAVRVVPIRPRDVRRRVSRRTGPVAR